MDKLYQVLLARHKQQRIHRIKDSICEWAALEIPSTTRWLAALATRLAPPPSPPYLVDQVVASLELVLESMEIHYLREKNLVLSRTTPSLNTSEAAIKIAII